MNQEYEVPTWKKWSSMYCAKCFTWLGNYKGWNKNPLELYCRKCTREEQDEQKTFVTDGISKESKT